MKNEATANFTKLNLLSELVPLSAPLSVAISPNNICNIQCQYCYHGSEKKQEDIRNKTYVPTRISEDCFERIVSQLEEFGEPIKQITLIGSGEPLVNQNLPDMIHTLKARVAEKVKISSNALMLTHNWSEKLIQSGLDVFKVSIQGIRSEVYRTMCGAHMDFKNLVDELTYFSSIRGSCKLHIKCVDAALDFSAGEDKQFFEIFKPIADFVQIENLNETDENGRIIDERNRWDDSIDVHNAKVCYFPFYFLDILENGDIAPCCNTRFHIANIYAHSLKEVWTQQVHTLCENMLSGQIDQLPLCSNCTIWKNLMRPENFLDDARDAILERWKIHE